MSRSSPDRLKRNQTKMFEQYLYSDKDKYDPTRDGGALLAFRAKDVPDPNSYEAKHERDDADHTCSHGDIHA